MPIKEIRIHIGARSSRKDDERYRGLAAAYDRFLPASICEVNTVRLRPERQRRLTHGNDEHDVSPLQDTYWPRQESQCAHINRDFDDASNGALKPNITQSQADPFSSTNAAFHDPERSLRDVRRVANASVSSCLTTERHGKPFPDDSRSRKRPRTAPGSLETHPSSRDAPLAPLKLSRKRARTSYIRRNDVYLDDTLDAAAVISSQLWSDPSQLLQEEGWMMAEHDPDAQGQPQEEGDVAIERKRPIFSDKDAEKDPAQELPSDTSPSSSAVPSSVHASSKEIVYPPAPPIESPYSSLGTMTALTQVLAPLPPTANHAFRSLSFLTPELEGLSAGNTIAEKYEAYAQHFRKIDTHERGHWRFAMQLSSNGQELEKQDRVLRAGILDVTKPGNFWNILKDFVKTGRTHWSAGCACEMFASTRLFKIFCMGQAIPWIYILMSHASYGRISKVNAEWVDGDDRVVVKVPAR